MTATFTIEYYALAAFTSFICLSLFALGFTLGSVAHAYKTSNNPVLEDNYLTPPPEVESEGSVEEEIPTPVDEEIPTPVVTREIFFHGKHRGDFYVYPADRALPNKWDTHLHADNFCSNHGPPALVNNKGITRYRCLGHNSEDELANSKEEWGRETYTGRNKTQTGFHIKRVPQE